MEAKVFTIASSGDFATALARGLIARHDPGTDPLALVSAVIYLPTKRAARTLTDAFAELLGGAALLPEIRAMGDAGDDELWPGGPEGHLSIARPIGLIRQRLLLAAMVERWSAARKSPLGFAQAAALAKSLADFLFEAQTARVDLANLESLVPASLAAHWAEVRDFLLLLRDVWPEVLSAEQACDPAEHRNRILAAQTAAYRNNPPSTPVIAAGSTGSIPATAELLAAIARLPQGAVVLPGLDQELDEASWQRLEDGHPQFGLKQLIQAIGIDRSAVKSWSGGADRGPRTAFLREALRPAPTTDAWRALAASGDGSMGSALNGLTLIEAATPSEEAVTVALILRHAVETDGQTAALVTPDRGLGRRVAAELQRWGIAIDDSAGRPLSHTPPGELLCLIADAQESRFSPVSLLALLKHPLAACGGAPAAFRTNARRLDMALRGPAPDMGLGAISAAIRNDESLAAWFSAVYAALSPMDVPLGQSPIGLEELLDGHISAAEALAATDRDSGAGILWSGDAGLAANLLLRDLREAARGLPAIEARFYPALIRGLLGEQAVRPSFGMHPRLAILGPLEARLQRFDVTVLGGLNEASWPQSARADPWLSRPMRRALGLEQPERDIGRAAHDFAILAAAPRVILTRAMRAAGAPTVASRWWQRITQLASGLGMADRLQCGTGYLAMARALDQPAARATPSARPAPRPPVSVRPRDLSVTEIETWLRDPYAIYAKHVLKLRPLDPLEASLGPLERGTAIHKALELFTREYPDTLPAEAEFRLIALTQELFAQLNLPRAASALWMPRIFRAAKWFVAQERQRRLAITRSHVEIKGEAILSGPAGAFRLRARADRIDELKEGGAAIVDYKSGAPPSEKQVAALLSPQLPLEAGIAAAGGFAGLGPLEPRELLYVRFSGGLEPGKFQFIKASPAELAAHAISKLTARIAEFDQLHTPYLPRVMPFSVDSSGDYDHLARVREWSLGGWEGEE